jgi:hypothetical protein
MKQSYPKIRFLLNKTLSSLILPLIYNCLLLEEKAVISQQGKGFGSFWRCLMDFYQPTYGKPRVGEQSHSFILDTATQVG